MDLYVIRHAWAGHFGDPAWPDDTQRPLSDEGRARFAKVVTALAGRDFAPEIIATSPMVRCRQTAELIARGVGGGKVVEHESLLPGGDLRQLVAWTAKHARQYTRLAWVGHAPDVSRLTSQMLAGTPEDWLHFAKGAIAALRFDAPPQPGSGELRWMVTAKILGC